MTVVIWDNVGADLKFFVTDQNVAHLNNKYVNSVETTDEEVDQISELVYTESGEQKVPMTSEFPVEAVRQGATVITMGFLL